MSYKIKNAITSSEVKELLYWMDNEGNHYLQDNMHARSKSVNVSANDWPKKLVQNILKRNNLLAPFEEVIFWTHKKSFPNSQGLHADTSDGNQDKLGKNILIPLRFKEDAATVILKNRWYGPDAKFGYKRENKNKTSVLDLKLVEGYNSDILFDKTIHEKYLKHIDINLLHGFSVDSVEIWEPNTILTWDRQQVHCSAQVTYPKTALVIFANK